MFEPELSSIEAATCPDCGGTARKPKPVRVDRKHASWADCPNRVFHSGSVNGYDSSARTSAS